MNKRQRKKKTIKYVCAQLDKLYNQGVKEVTINVQLPGKIVNIGPIEFGFYKGGK